MKLCIDYWSTVWWSNCWHSHASSSVVLGPNAGIYTCFTLIATLVKDVGLPRDWLIPPEIYSEGGIL